MAKVKSKEHKLDLFGKVLPAIDRGDKNFYNNLTDEEKKEYVPKILMRYMSSLGNQNPNSAYAVIAVNELLNIGFWTLSKHPELQHLLFCIAGLGSKQYHPWIPFNKIGSKTKIVDQLLIDLNPGINENELAILRSQYNAKSIKLLAQDAGKSDHEVKQLVEDAKALN